MGTKLIVAAADASKGIKDRADYICDGIDDHVEIQAAMSRIAATGGTIQLVGTFDCWNWARSLLNNDCLIVEEDLGELQ